MLGTCWRYIRAALFILLISLLLLEAVLQAGALLLQKRSGLTPGLPVAGKTRVVTLGDSNTYGLYVSETEAWPSVLESEWNRQRPQQPLQVINLGFPGTNSSRLLKSLPDVIRTFSPDIILVMVGVNDFWTAPVEVEGIVAPLSPVEGWLRDHSRTYKLVYMLWREFSYDSTALQVDDEFRQRGYDAADEARFKSAVAGTGGPATADKPSAIRYGNQTFDIGYVFSNRQQKPAEAMQHNLVQMADMARRSGVKLVFMTYPYFEQPQKTANQQMKVVGKSQHVPVINLAKVFREACASGEERCQQLFFPDFHLTAEGYRLLVQALLPALPEALAGQPQLDALDD